jgi:hypothetical protein
VNQWQWWLGLGIAPSGLELGPDHEPKNPKKFEAKFLETFMDAKPGRKTIFLLTNRMPNPNPNPNPNPIKHYDNSVY